MTDKEDLGGVGEKRYTAHTVLKPPPAPKHTHMYWILGVAESSHKSQEREKEAIAYDPQMTSPPDLQMTLQ